MAEETKLVRMVRTPEMANGGPVSADVHPDEVANFALGGWVKSDSAVKPLSAEELIACIKAAGTADEVNNLVGADKRATVLAAAKARADELSKG